MSAISDNFVLVRASIAAHNATAMQVFVQSSSRGDHGQGQESEHLDALTPLRVMQKFTRSALRAERPLLLPPHLSAPTASHRYTTEVGHAKLVGLGHTTHCTARSPLSTDVLLGLALQSLSAFVGTLASSVDRAALSVWYPDRILIICDFNVSCAVRATTQAKTAREPI